MSDTDSLGAFQCGGLFINQAANCAKWLSFIIKNKYGPGVKRTTWCLERAVHIRQQSNLNRVQHNAPRITGLEQVFATS